MNKTFGKNLKRLRSHSEWSQEDAAAAIGIKRSTYASYEEHRAEPSQDILKKIADAFGVTNMYAMLYNEKFLVTKESCVFDVSIASQESRRVVDKYNRVKPEIRRAIDLLLAVK